MFLSCPNYNFEKVDQEKLLQEIRGQGEGEMGLKAGELAIRIY
jgi:hypothetical protein